MTLITLSYTGENSTGSATFTIAKEYKFKNIYLEDVKYYIASETLENSIDKSTSNAGLGTVTTTITSPLALKFSFLDSKDCVLYSLADGSGETLNTAQNITGLIPIGRADKVGLTPSSMNSTLSHNYPYKLVSNRPQTWDTSKTITIDIYYRDVTTDGLIKDWALISGSSNTFGDICSIDITLRLE
tara:strand:+ start:94 stop:651 length:558 start_codon:yes stop_codon:yes gene_type:complete